MPPLSAPSLATFRALLDRIIPADDFPGALETGVEHYVSQHFINDLPGTHWLTSGLAQLDVEAIARHGTGLTFVGLNPEKQDSLLREIEARHSLGSHPSENSVATFFARMVELVHEGYYADPGNGGNREAVSWRMIGYDPRVPPPAKR